MTCFLKLCDSKVFEMQNKKLVYTECLSSKDPEDLNTGVIKYNSDTPRHPKTPQDTTRQRVQFTMAGLLGVIYLRWQVCRSWVPAFLVHHMPD